MNQMIHSSHPIFCSRHLEPPLIHVLVFISSLLFIPFFFSSAAFAQTSPDTSEELVIRDVTVLSPERQEPLKHAYVLIRNGRIADIRTEPITGRHEIDGSGQFLVPGLIDSHVHLGQIAGMQPVHESKHPEIAGAAREQTPKSYLYFGFTSVIDLFSQAEGIAEWNETDIRPDAYFCGGAPIANGYPMSFLPEEVRFEAAQYVLYDEKKSEQLPDNINAANHTPEAVVSRIAAEGAICVKTFYEPGFGNMGRLPTPTEEMIRNLVAAAHAENLPVLVHANSKEAQEFAISTGADIVAHGLWNGFTTEEGELEKDVETLLQFIADNNVGYQPTIQVLHGELGLFDNSFLKNPMLSHVVPSILIEWYGTEEGRWFRDQMAANLDGLDINTIYAPILERLERVVAAANENGTKFLFGSDTPSGPTYANPPGLNAWFEMKRWIDAGISEEKLFRALTLNNAKAFGLEKDLGSIEAGKVAHLLLLDENPLKSVAAYNSIEKVILAGRPINRTELSAVK